MATTTADHDAVADGAQDEQWENMSITDKAMVYARVLAVSFVPAVLLSEVLAVGECTINLALTRPAVELLGLHGGARGHALVALSAAAAAAAAASSSASSSAASSSSSATTTTAAAAAASSSSTLAALANPTLVSIAAPFAAWQSYTGPLSAARWEASRRPFWRVAVCPPGFRLRLWQCAWNFGSGMLSFDCMITPGSQVSAVEHAALEARAHRDDELQEWFDDAVDEYWAPATLARRLAINAVFFLPLRVFVEPAVQLLQWSAHYRAESAAWPQSTGEALFLSARYVCDRRSWRAVAGFVAVSLLYDSINLCLEDYLEARRRRASFLALTEAWQQHEELPAGSAEVTRHVVFARCVAQRSLVNARALAFTAPFTFTGQLLLLAYSFRMLTNVPGAGSALLPTLTHDSVECVAQQTLSLLPDGSASAWRLASRALPAIIVADFTARCLSDTLSFALVYYDWYS